MTYPNLPWTPRKVRILLDGISIEKVELTDGRTVDVDYNGLSYYESRAKALHEGNPTLLLDPIQLDHAISEMPSDAHRAAIILKLYGMDETTIGSVLKGFKPGYRLVEEAIKEVVRIERKRYNLRRELVG